MRAVELRPLDLSAYLGISEAFAGDDAARCDRIAELCAMATIALSRSESRFWYSPVYADIGGQSWRDVTRSMFEGFLRDGRAARVQTLEQWGEELASHLMIALAMPSFQTDYALVKGALRTDAPGISSTAADALSQLARRELDCPELNGELRIEWGDPVTLVILGEIDGGLQKALESVDSVRLLLRADGPERGPIGLAGEWARVIARADLVALKNRLGRIEDAISGYTAQVAQHLRALIEFAQNGPGALLVSNRPKRW